MLNYAVACSDSRFIVGLFCCDHSDGILQYNGDVLNRQTYSMFSQESRYILIYYI